MSYHNICSYGEIKKINPELSSSNNSPQQVHCNCNICQKKKKKIYIYILTLTRARNSRPQSNCILKCAFTLFTRYV